MFSDHKGIEMGEFVTALALVIVVIGAVIWAISQSAKTQGTNVSSWITSLNVPTAP